jgi:hypothetical protein
MNLVLKNYFDSVQGHSEAAVRFYQISKGFSLMLKNVGLQIVDESRTVRGKVFG